MHEQAKRYDITHIIVFQIMVTNDKNQLSFTRKFIISITTQTRSHTYYDKQKQKQFRFQIQVYSMYK